MAVTIGWPPDWWRDGATKLLVWGRQATPHFWSRWLQVAPLRATMLSLVLLNNSLGHGEAAAELIEGMAAREDLAMEGDGQAGDVRMDDAVDEDGLHGGASDVTDEDLCVPAEIPLSEEPIFDSVAGPLAGDDGIDGAETPAIAGGVRQAMIDVPAGLPGSSGDAVLPPPLPPPMAAPEAGEGQKKKRQAALAVVFVPGGKLTYYYSAKNAICTAECRNKSHGRCVMTKTMRGRADKTNARLRGQGRPVGYLAAWLAKGAEYVSKAQHWAVENQPTFAERRAARDLVKADEAVDARQLFAGESSASEGGSEPERVP